MSNSDEKATTSKSIYSGTKCDPSHLECKICLDPCASPIYNCPNGHLTCGLCYDKLNPKKCPLKCEGALTPSFLGERLSRELDMRIDCLHSQSGCSTPIKATLLKDHLTTCDYRDMLCKLGVPGDNSNLLEVSRRFQEVSRRFPGDSRRFREILRRIQEEFPRDNSNAAGAASTTCNKLVPLWNYRQHLTEFHKISLLEDDSDLVINLSKVFSQGDPSSLEYWKGPRSFDVVPIEYCGKIIHLHTAIFNSFFYWWFTILGDPDEGEDLVVKTRLVPRKGSTHQLKTALPILGFHGNSEFDQFSGSYGVVSGATLNKFYNKTRSKTRHEITLFVSVRTLTSEMETVGNSSGNPDAATDSDNECPEGEGERTIKFTVQNISQLREQVFSHRGPVWHTKDITGLISSVRGDKDCFVFSPPTLIRNLYWKIMITPRSDNAGNMRSLGFFLHCDGESGSTRWSCKAEANLKILSRNGEPFSRKISHGFHTAEYDWGYANFIDYPTLMDPTKGFVHEDTITFEIDVKADPPHGLSRRTKKRKIH